MRRDVAGSVLVAVGVVLATVTLSGRFLDYVRPAHRLWLLGTALVLVVVGAVELLRWTRSPDPDPGPRSARLHTHGPRAVGPDEVAAARDEDRGAHGHGRGPVIGGLLALPVVLLLLLPPPPVGSWVAARQGSGVPMPTGAARHPGPLPAGTPVDVAVHDYAARAVWDAGRTLVGREVALTGFVTPAPDGGWYVARAVISCCAADARASLVAVSGAAAPPADTWVRVVGGYVPSGPDPATADARLAASSVTVVPTPAEPYEPAG